MKWNLFGTPATQGNTREIEVKSPQWLKCNGNFFETYKFHFRPISSAFFDFGGALLPTHVATSLKLMWRNSPNSYSGSIYTVFWNIGHPCQDVRSTELSLKWQDATSYFWLRAVTSARELCCSVLSFWLCHLYHLLYHVSYHLPFVLASLLDLSWILWNCGVFLVQSITDYSCWTKETWQSSCAFCPYCCTKLKAQILGKLWDFRNAKTGRHFFSRYGSACIRCKCSLWVGNAKLHETKAYQFHYITVGWLKIGGSTNQPNNMSQTVPQITCPNNWFKRLVGW